MYAGDARASLPVTSPSSSRVVSSGGSRDVFWERALLALPDTLLSPEGGGPRRPWGALRVPQSARGGVGGGDW